jgi:hypothetical protein
VIVYAQYGNGAADEDDKFVTSTLTAKECAPLLPVPPADAPAPATPAVPAAPAPAADPQPKPAPQLKVQPTPAPTTTVVGTPSTLPSTGSPYADNFAFAGLGFLIAGIALVTLSRTRPRAAQA